MDCLFETTTMYTFQEYKRFCKTLMNSRRGIARLVILELLMILLGGILDNAFLFMFAVLYPCLMVWLQNRQIKKLYFSNKVMQDAKVRFRFCDTCFTEIKAIGESTIEYAKLDQIIETKTNFYLMISKNQGFILTKANFPQGLEAFLHTLKTSTKA